MLDVIVVGAGISGLTCAIALARFSNARVTVLEKEAVMNKVASSSFPGSRDPDKKKKEQRKEGRKEERKEEKGKREHDSLFPLARLRHPDYIACAGG